MSSYERENDISFDDVTQSSTIVEHDSSSSTETSLSTNSQSVIDLDLNYLDYVEDVEAEGAF